MYSTQTAMKRHLTDLPSVAQQRTTQTARSEKMGVDSEEIVGTALVWGRCSESHFA